MACEQTSSAAMNDERQKDLERINVMFLCDEWKSSKGGLSTFNREFAVNLAKTTSDSIKVHCYVAQSDELSREDARQHGVNLITARSIPGSSDPLDWLKIPPPELPNPDIVVGHGRKFGTPAYFIVRAAKCKWMHFVHVFCEDLGKFKATQSAAVDTIEENEKKHKREIELCKAADVVVAVGSRLQQKYSKCLPHVEVEIITPGILETFSNESIQLVKDKSMVIAKKFSVFMFGRASFEDLTLKGYDIVANAIGSLDKMFELTFVGSSPGEHRKIEQWFLDNTCISRNQLTIRSYCNEQDELKMMFHESDMIALPSRTEGFGLVALEAISGSIPVLVAGESGIAETLRGVEGGQSVIVDSDDSEEWAQRIQLLSSQSPEERGNNAKLLRDNYNKTYTWNNECERFQRMIQDLAQSLNALKLRIDVETMKPAEHDTQAYRTPAATVESGGSQNGQHQEVSAVPVSSGQTQPSCTGAEAPQAPSPIPTEGEVLRLIAANYLQATPLRSKDDCNDFLAYMKEMHVIITGVGIGSLLITVKCDSLQILERLWEDYLFGQLSEVVQSCFVTEEILTELGLAELKLKTTIIEEEYRAYRVHFEKDRVGDQCGRVAVPREKPTYFTKEDTSSKRDDEGILSSSSSRPASHFVDSASKVSGKLHEMYHIVTAGLKTFDVSLPEGLQDYVTYLNDKMYSTVQESHSLKHLTKAMDDEELKQFVSVHVKEGAWQVVMLFLDELMHRQGVPSSKIFTGTPPVAEFERKGGETGENTESDDLKLRTLTWWPTKEDQDLVTLCEILTKSDCRMNSLNLSDKLVITDEGVKHLSEALMHSNCKLNTLDLSGNSKITNKGVKQLTAALTQSNCNLNSLILSYTNEITDEGVTHLADALMDSNCKLNSLDLSWNDKITGEGVHRLADALMHNNCKLTSLNLMFLRAITDKEVKHLADALTHINCKLNSLNLYYVEVADEGVKYLAEAYIHSNCNINISHLSLIKVTDELVKCLGEALTSKITSVKITK